MSVRTKVLASGALAIAVVGWAGCGAWDAETRARDRAREWLDCPQVELTRYSEHAWRAAGCSRQVDVACTTADNEPECIRVRFPAAVAAADEPEVEVGPGAAATAPARGPDEGAGPERQPPTAGAEVGAAEAGVRAAIDAARGDVLACVARERVVVRASWDAEGAISLALQGELAGSAEEGCVRAALSHLSVPAGAPGTLLHLVR